MQSEKNGVNNTVADKADVHFIRLFDVYGGLLTKTQQEISNLYFNCDLSLGEIAEQKGVSRQSISDCLHQCKNKLTEAEHKLHFLVTLAEAEQKLAAVTEENEKLKAALKDKDK